MRRVQSQSGQALAEFLIGAVFVMVPLFLLISAAGKHSDIKYAAVQAARYEAWEFTANYADLSEQPSGFSSVSNSELPQKSSLDVQRESRRRFFSDPDLTLSTRFDKGGYQVSDANPLWVYHDGSDMYNPLALDTVSRVEGSADTPDPTKVITAIISLADTIFSFLADVLSAINAGAGFDALNADGYATSRINVPIEEPPSFSYLTEASRAPLYMEELNLTFEAQAAVLTDSWSAGGADHTLYQAKGLTPTTLLDVLLNPGGFPLQDVAAYGLLSPELSSSSLQFGYMEKDTIHPSKLDTGGDHSCSDGGYCEFE